MAQRLDGQLTAAGMGRKNYFLARLHSINPHVIRGMQSASFAYNTMCMPVISYAPLLSGLTLEMLTVMEKALVNSATKAMGLVTRDGKELLFVLKNRLGCGVRLVTMVHLVNIACESEVLLNGQGLASEAVRARLAPAHLNPVVSSQMGNNYITQATTMLSPFGVY